MQSPQSIGPGGNVNLFPVILAWRTFATLLPIVRLVVLDVVLGFDLVLDRGAGGDAVEFEHRSADRVRDPTAARRSVTGLAAHAVDEGPHQRDGADHEGDEGEGQQDQKLECHLRSPLEVVTVG